MEQKIEKNNEIKIRNLKARDIKPFINLIKKIQLWGVVKDLFSTDTKSKADAKNKKVEVKAEIKVANIIETILENFEQCEEELFLFMSSVSNVEPEDVGDLDIDVLIDILKSIFKDKAFSFFTGSQQQ